MLLTEMLLAFLLVLAASGATLLGILWLAFTCRELWLAHLLSRSRRTRREADANTSV